MVAKEISSGRSIAGAVAYITHDQTSPSDRQPQTSERVAWTHCLGLPVEDPELMVRIMQGLTADAPGIKQRNGISNRGRKLQHAYKHMVLSWDEGQVPSMDVALEAAAGALKAVGIDERHYAVCAAHTDTDNWHFHIVYSCIDPETGRAINPKRSHLALSRWAENWERANGGIQPSTEARPLRNRARRDREEIALGLEAAGATKAEAWDRTRKAVAMPPMKRCGIAPEKRSGRPKRTDQDRAEWRDVYRVHADHETPEFRAACRALNRRQQVRRKVRRWIPLPKRKPPPPRPWKEVVIERVSRARGHLYGVQATLQTADAQPDIPWERANAIRTALRTVAELLERTAQILRGLVTKRDRIDQLNRESRARHEARLNSRTIQTHRQTRPAPAPAPARDGPAAPERADPPRPGLPDLGPAATPPAAAAPARGAAEAAARRQKRPRPQTTPPPPTFVAGHVNPTPPKAPAPAAEAAQNRGQNRDSQSR